MIECHNTNADTVIVVDFETTGMSPDHGDRAIEVGAVKLGGGEIVDRFKCLMNPGIRVNGFIEDYTGISNAMLQKAPPCEDVMDEFACSMLAARRVYPDAPNHKLGTLVAFNHLPSDGTFHRALADVEMTAHLWLGMLKDIRREYRIESISFSLMQALSRVSKAAAPGFLRRWTGPPS